MKETKYLIPDAGKEKSHYQQKLKTEAKAIYRDFFKLVIETTNKSEIVF